MPGRPSDLRLKEQGITMPGRTIWQPPDLVLQEFRGVFGFIAILGRRKAAPASAACWTG
jgi:hypothetical protein